MKTPNSETYRSHSVTTKSGHRFLEFGVRSCQNARLVLSTVNFGVPLYEIVLGSDGNTKSKVIRYEDDGSGNWNSSLKAEETTPGVIDCLQSRWFWLSWNGGLIEVARGSASGQRFLSWQDDSPHNVFAVSFSTGPGDFGDWTYLYTSGDYYFCY